jgi:hypothetical protein
MRSRRCNVEDYGDCDGDGENADYEEDGGGDKEEQAAGIKSQHEEQDEDE